MSGPEFRLAREAAVTRVVGSAGKTPSQCCCFPNGWEGAPGSPHPQKLLSIAGATLDLAVLAASLVTAASVSWEARGGQLQGWSIQLPHSVMDDLIRTGGRDRF